MSAGRPIQPWDESWWTYAAREGLPTSVSTRRIERGCYAVKKPVRDYLGEPIDYLALPLEYLMRRR